MIPEHPRRQSESIPSSLRASGSLAQLNLYTPPYERSSSVEAITNDFGELGVIEPRRRESFPVGYLNN